MNLATGHVAVIGGGIIGTACAHYLRRAGWRVTILEAGDFGMGCSHANCGLVVPSHVLPLAEPAALREGLHSLFRHNAPLAVRPRFDPLLWGWLFRFALRCNRKAMLEAGRAIHALLDSSMSLYRTLMEAEPLDCEWEARGLLFPYKDPEALEKYAATDRLLREHFGMSAKRLDGDALTEMEPALKSGLAGGWYYEEEAHLRPDRLLASWRALLEREGVTIRERCPVRCLVHAHRRAYSAFTPQGEVPAEAFVVAAGAHTPALSRDLGCRIPIQPGKGYSITTARPARCPRRPLLFPETHVAVTPLHSGYRLGSTMEFAGFDRVLRPERLRLLREGAEPYLHEPAGEPVEEEWYGFRPMTYDGKPIIGRSPTLANVVVAAGHNMLGLSMAPATGKLVAELLSGQVPHLDPTPYAATRF
jgi:D-amino-acid dehydrogenase